MKNLKIGKVLSILLVMALVYVAGNLIETGYLNNTKYNLQIDTIGSASVNDTGWTYSNTAGWDYLRVEYLQNSIISTFKVNYPGVNNLRLRYLASDSTLWAEVSGVAAPLSWVRVPIIINSSSTNQDKLQIPLRTGNFIYSVRGEKN